VHCALLTRYTPPTGGTIFHLPQYIPTIWLIALIEDPAVIVRFLGHLGLPTDIPKARAPPLTSSVMRLRLRSLALRRTRLTQPVPRQPARRAPRRLESRLTAARRIDTMPFRGGL